jgi:transposase
MLCLGIDIGKKSHDIYFLSKELLARFKRPEKCPHVRIENRRAGFEQLSARIREYGSPNKTHVLLEATGPYGLALEHYLQEYGVQLHRITARDRHRKNKTDKQDALGLAVRAYNKLALGAHTEDDRYVIRKLSRPTEIARKLKGLTRHRDELEREIKRRHNKLTAIIDELFPELTDVYKHLNSPSVLSLREKFPTPEDIASAHVADLMATRKRYLPTKANLLHLQKLAKRTIGTKDEHRISSLVIEQRQLIAELALLQTHADELDVIIAEIVDACREGQILTSFIGIGHQHAATIIAAIANLANFDTLPRLRSYFGWAPRMTQSGTTLDSTALSKEGNHALKKTIALITYVAIQHDPTWRALYERLVPIKCAYDARRKVYLGKMKVVGRIAGQLIRVIWTLLKRDAELQASHKDGPLPPPELYDVAKHHVTHAGTSARSQE